MPEDWGEFYFMIGSSAAGLIGLLFVVVTLTADIERRRAVRGQRLFMTPTVFHFAVVLLLCALATAHSIHAPTFAIVTAAAAVFGFLYMVSGLAGLLKPSAIEHWTDLVFYGFAPTAGYVALGVAAWGIYDGQWFATGLMAGLMLGFLLLGIRNAWDLVTWIAPRTGRSDPRADQANDPPSPN